MRKADGDGRLLERARRAGVQTEYRDDSGKTRRASLDVLRAVLSTMDSGLERVGPLPPVQVAWEGARAKVAVGAQVSRADFELIPEDGGAAVSLGRPVHGVVRLPVLPTGYHRLICGQGETLVICAPRRAWEPEGKRRKQWGIFAPVYSLRSPGNWGAGDFSDFQKLGRWAGALGAGVVGTLPLLSAFVGGPVREPSPYSPASRLFWNEFFIDVTASAEWDSSGLWTTRLKRESKQLRVADLVDYDAVMKLKRVALEKMARLFFSGSNAAFEEFLRERPEVEDYARFRAATEKAGSGWPAWERRMRTGKILPGDYAEPVRRYYLYAQWLAQQQMSALIDSNREAGVRLYLDLPLGVHPDSYDVWRHPGVFAQGANVGAPPDAFFTKGQEWGFPPLNPSALRRSGYKYWVESLRFQMRHAGMLRLDHVMGLHRLYWVPRGFPATHGAYVSYCAEEMWAILNLESHRFKTVLVGENLGTVPPAVNEAMDRHGIRKMFVVQYEMRPEARRALPAPPRQSVASLNTHDMPPFAAVWHGADLADRCDLGLIPAGNLDAEREARKKLKTALALFLRQRGRASVGTITRAAIRFLGRSAAETVLINLEDLWGEERPQNVPGTSSERPNWRRKLKLSLAGLERAGELRRFLAGMRKG